MKVTYSPQRSDVPLSYAIDAAAETITATQGEVSDVFDLSALPDGREAIITSDLDPCPVRSATRINGELHVTLRSHHGLNPTQAEAFPAEEIY